VNEGGRAAAARRALGALTLTFRVPNFLIPAWLLSRLLADDLKRERTDTFVTRTHFYD
jgi:hypothetical protein